MADNRQPQRPRQVRLPGFLVTEDIGLGDAIKKATSTLGISPCGGCQQRAARVNQRVMLSPWRRH